MGIIYVGGDATNPIGNGLRIIVHVCNDIGGWGAGFVLALSKRWLEPERRYREWHKTGGPPPFALGQVQFVQVEDSVWAANLVGQHGTRRTKTDGPPVRYDAIRKGLRCVAGRAKVLGASVHMPRIGCGLAGGDWTVVRDLIETELIANGVAVTVYDLPHPSSPLPADT